MPCIRLLFRIAYGQLVNQLLAVVCLSALAFLDRKCVQGNESSACKPDGDVQIAADAAFKVWDPQASVARHSGSEATRRAIENSACSFQTLQRCLGVSKSDLKILPMNPKLTFDFLYSLLEPRERLAPRPRQKQVQMVPGQTLLCDSRLKIVIGRPMEHPVAVSKHSFER